MKQTIITVEGPTASGKTALSVALAKILRTEVISADSMQIYRHMDIGTAKPTAEEIQGVPHHMLDICEPWETFSVAKYVSLADAAAQDILRRGKIPIVSGGTGLYVNALLEGNTFSGEETDVAYRETLKKLYEERGAEYLFQLLKQVDPESGKTLHPNNVKRVIRALEVYQQTGKTIGELNRSHKRSEPKYQAVRLAVCPADREYLYERINRRVDQMVEAGLLLETETLLQKGLLQQTAGQAIAYKELLPYFRGEAPLEDCLEKLRQRSRNYAKRQLTWLRREKDIHWIYYQRRDEFRDILNSSTEYLKEKGVI